jgi:general secretion pathway protein G
MRANVRLSYVEIFIVAVVLGVGGRIAVPQLAEASTEEKVCRLVDGLGTMRANLDLYRAEHGGNLPAVDTFAGFEAAMTTQVGQCGPYVEEEIPTNPFNELNTVRFDGEPAGAGKAGWRLDTQSGLFQADNDAAYAAL